MYFYVCGKLSVIHKHTHTHTHTHKIFKPFPHNICRFGELTNDDGDSRFGVLGTNVSAYVVAYLDSKLHPR